MRGTLFYGLESWKGWCTVYRRIIFFIQDVSYWDDDEISEIL